MQNKRKQKTIILFLTMICLILSICSISFAKSKKEEKKKGYVQLRAYLTEELQKLNPNIEVIISDGTEEGEATTTYLYAMNDYSGIVTLEEGNYVIEHAAIVGDDDGAFTLNIEGRNFTIKKGSPAQMFFSFGDAEIERKNKTNQNNKEEVSVGTKEDVDKLVKDDTEELGLDIYDKNGELDKEKIEEEYKNITGETYENTLEEDKKNGINKEGSMKEEGKKKVFSILKWIRQYGLLIVIIILIAVYQICKLLGIIKKDK